MPVGVYSDINIVLRHVNIKTLFCTPFQYSTRCFYVCLCGGTAANIGLFTVKNDRILKILIFSTQMCVKHTSGSTDLQQLASDKLIIFTLYILSDWFFRFICKSMSKFTCCHTQIGNSGANS